MLTDKETASNPKIRQSSNLAAEYYVASILFRLGYVVTVTFGNTKEIDLIVHDPQTHDTVTVDVKGLKNTTNWVMPKNPCQRPDHFYILVTFKNKFGDLDSVPEVYTLPSEEVTKLWVPWVRKKSVAIPGVWKKDVMAIRWSDLRKRSDFKGMQGIKLLFQKQKTVKPT